ncbi:hypothetical protein Moror_7940 [Moniliophthora roreri MCA 2997]|nr:hypothetical protein Moror_7940 [Moniliophthora roreri MCA 2997]KAI3604416.1 hypothetical protein WG66_008279 [Moniliophthora roreri]
MVQYYRFLPLLVAIAGAKSFTLNTPSNITVLKEFSVEWTSLPSDPQNITIIFYDLTRTPRCEASEVSHREKLIVVPGISAGQGRIDSLLYQHTGRFVLCAFSYQADPPQDNLRVSLFNSSEIFASISPETTTVTQTLPTSTSSFTPRKPINDATIIGGVLGGFFALVLALIIMLFSFCRVRVVRLQTDSSINADAPSTVATGSRNMTLSSRYTVSSLPPQSWSSTSGSGSQSGLERITEVEETLPSYDSLPRNHQRKR